VELNGQHQFAAPPEEIYDRLLDPDSLRTCLPGCERLERLSEDRLEISLAVPIPAVKGEYDGTIDIHDRDRPSSFRMEIDVSGKSGFVKADATMRVEPAGGGEGSVVTYEASAQVGGKAASVGQRVLTGISRRQVDQMMRCLDGDEKVGIFQRLLNWLRSTFGRGD